MMQWAAVITTVYLHRGLAHRAVSFSPAFAIVSRFTLWLGVGITARKWVAVHRKHHRFTDVEGDPHSPMIIGYWKLILNNAFITSKAGRDEFTQRRYAPDLKPDRLDKLLLDRFLLGPAITIVALVLLLGIWPGLVAYLTFLGGYVLGSACVNSLGHGFGTKRYDNTATNLRWLAVWTAGEGLHNNHHGHPASAKLSHGRGELDLGWVAIRALEKVGLVSKPRITFEKKVEARAA